MEQTVETICNVCGAVRTHRVLQDHETYRSDEDEGVWDEQTWQIIECAGCHDVSFRKRWMFSEYLDDEGQPEVFEELYPQRASRVAGAYHDLPPSIEGIYHESLTALNSGCYTLCIAGLRALVEGVCLDRGVNGIQVPTRSGGTRNKNDLEGKIMGMVQQGICTQAEADALDVHRLLGNRAVHGLSHPGKQAINAAFDVIEHILGTLYNLPSQTALLRAARPRTQP